MSHLEKFAQKNKKEKTVPVSFRLPESLHKDFTKRCDDLNLKIADALRILVAMEMSSPINGSDSHLETTSEQITDKHSHTNKSLKSVTVSKQNVIKSKTKKSK